MIRATMDDLPELLRSHYEDPYHRGQCERATHSSLSQDPATQHYVLMQLRVDDEGVIEEAWFESQGCVHCEAPASILAEYCESKSIHEFSTFDTASFLALTQLDQVADTVRCRMLAGCRMLAWTAFQNAINATDNEYEAGRPMFGGPSLGEES